MKIYLSVLILFLSFGFEAKTQIIVDSIKKVNEEKSTLIFNKFNEDEQVFFKLQEEANFPGGDKKWVDYLQKNINLNIPKENNAPKGNYSVVIRFIVAKDGKLFELVPETKNGYGMENEIMRLIQSGPNWISGKQNGAKVNSIKRQEVTFQIN